MRIAQLVSQLLGPQEGILDHVLGIIQAPDEAMGQPDQDGPVPDRIGAGEAGGGGGVR